MAKIQPNFESLSQAIDDVNKANTKRKGILNALGISGKSVVAYKNGDFYQKDLNFLGRIANAFGLIKETNLKKHRDVFQKALGEKQVEVLFAESSRVPLLKKILGGKFAKKSIEEQRTNELFQKETSGPENETGKQIEAESDDVLNLLEEAGKNAKDNKDVEKNTKNIEKERISSDEIAPFSNIAKKAEEAPKLTENVKYLDERNEALQTAAEEIRKYTQGPPNDVILLSNANEALKGLEKYLKGVLGSVSEQTPLSEEGKFRLESLVNFINLSVQPLINKMNSSEIKDGKDELSGSIALIKTELINIPESYRTDDLEQLLKSIGQGWSIKQ